MKRLWILTVIAACAGGSSTAPAIRMATTVRYAVASDQPASIMIGDIREDTVGSTITIHDTTIALAAGLTCDSVRLNLPPHHVEPVATFAVSGGLIDQHAYNGYDLSTAAAWGLIAGQSVYDTLYALTVGSTATCQALRL